MLSGFIKLLKSFSKKERIIFSAAFLIFFSSAVIFGAKFISDNTRLIPVLGGKYIEGAVGQPAYINPILAQSDTDRDLVAITFDNLSNMAESYKMSDNGKTWRYRLKNGLLWSDGAPITSDDVIFTIEAIQNPDTYSPLYLSWQGVKVSRVSELEIEFSLPQPYVFFQNTLEEVRPIPKHIFADIPFANFKLSNYNLEPVGSGPFEFKSFRKKADGFINLYSLVRNDNYQNKAYLNEVDFVFFNNESDLVSGFNLGIIDGFGGMQPEINAYIYFPHDERSLRMLKYYAIFLNPYSNEALKDKNVKFALSLATDKNEIIKKIFKDQAIEAVGPLVDGSNDFAPDVYPKDDFSIDKANSIFDAAGWQKGDDGIREKQNGNEVLKLEFNLVVPDIKFLVDTANLIKDDWAKAGVKLNILTSSLSQINNDIIKNRDYQMILFGNIIGESSDLFSFWHSSERFYPGFNLSLYENKTADNLIETIRKDFDNNKREADLASLQSLIAQDQPAIFLYSPNYLYVSKKKLGGFDDKVISLPSDRFKNISKWFVNTARVFK